MDGIKEIKGKLIYEQDSKKYHRFKIITETEGAVVGKQKGEQIANGAGGKWPP